MLIIKTHLTYNKRVKTESKAMLITRTQKKENSINYQQNPEIF